MTNNTFWLVLAIVILGLAGIISAGLVYLDLRRRSVGGGERFMWLLLALLLPGFGLGVYFFIRLLNAFLTPEGSQEAPLWVTRFKRPSPGPAGQASPPVGRGTTIPAIDLLRPPPAPGFGGVDYQLVVTSGPEAGKSFRIEYLPAVIGRGQGVSIQLDSDQSVSRQHAELYLQGSMLRIRDLNSAHGTQVNGFSIQDKSLDAGDRIEIGRTVIQVKPAGRGRR